jgi:hypothetical protein
VGNISSLNGELILDGVDACNSLSIDFKGTYVGTHEISGTINGSDWLIIPLVPKDPNQLKAIIASVPPASIVAYEADIAAYQAVKVRNTAYTSGTANIVMVASNSPLAQSVVRAATFRSPTALSPLSGAGSLSLPAPGAGLRHYILSIQIDRINGSTTALTAVATPLAVAISNTLDSLAWSVPQDALAAGGISTVNKDFGARPLATNAQNTVTTITAPATTNVIWRITAYYFVAP